MSQIDISKINHDSLVDISTVSIDPEMPQAERIERYLEQIHNPYCFLSGDTAVRIRFVGDKDLSKSLVEYFSRLKQK